MSAREVVVCAARAWCHDSSDPKAAADRLLAAYDAENAAELVRLQARVDALQADAELLDFQERITLPELRRTIEHHKDGKQRWRERAEKAEGALPSRFRATPAEVDWYLRKILTEDTLLNYQRAIGNRAVEEAAEEIRQEAGRLKAHGVLEPDKDWAATSAADWIDTSKEGGHYPSRLLCARHDGFNPCPGAPRCTPREDEEVAR